MHILLYSKDLLTKLNNNHQKKKHTNTWLIVYISRRTNQPVKYIHTTWQLTIQIHNHILT